MLKFVINNLISIAATIFMITVFGLSLYVFGNGVVKGIGVIIAFLPLVAVVGHIGINRINRFDYVSYSDYQRPF